MMSVCFPTSEVTAQGQGAGETGRKVLTRRSPGCGCEAMRRETPKHRRWVNGRGPQEANEDQDPQGPHRRTHQSCRGHVWRVLTDHGGVQPLTVGKSSRGAESGLSRVTGTPTFPARTSGRAKCGVFAVEHASGSTVERVLRRGWSWRTRRRGPRSKKSRAGAGGTEGRRAKEGGSGQCHGAPMHSVP